jgi:hypothetical protein
MFDYIYANQIPKLQKHAYQDFIKKPSYLNFHKKAKIHNLENYGFSK